MAKKKTKNKGTQKKSTSPQRFMREQVRKLPIGRCFITPDWHQSGIAQIYVSRVKPDGNIVLGIFLVDTFCAGVKDTKYFVNISKSEFDNLIADLKNQVGLDEIGYTEAHNIIYGAISFAREGGINPNTGFNIAGFVLERDTEDIPLIEYDFGKDGRHYLILNDRSEMHYLNSLKRTLGDDFEYSVDFDDDEEEEMEEDFLPHLKFYPSEEYSYTYPEYPSTLSVKNKFIADELLSPNNYSGLSRETIDRILALPADEVADDLSNIIMYVIGQTYEGINNGTIKEINHGALLHSVLLLSQLDSERGLDALLEIMRQNEDFIDCHLGDYTTELVYKAVYACGRNQIDKIVSYIYQPGFYTYLRLQGVEALCMIAHNHPERRDEILGILRELMHSMVDRLPKREACDETFAGLMICDLVDIKAKELIPEIENLFSTGCVDEGAGGDLDSVVKDIQDPEYPINKERFMLPDILEEYNRFKHT